MYKCMGLTSITITITIERREDDKKVRENWEEVKAREVKQKNSQTDRQDKKTSWPEDKHEVEGLYGDKENSVEYGE